ncbi:helix-turn-helix domain-containing protein [Nonomuraea sp. M3C6]|uniref:Helix-turn-helix domain-containing protein n=1 Tax=Nonomuraea marmarensis TaxID=3351344 RepID=A0ABW7ATT1_9ACTN
MDAEHPIWRTALTRATMKTATPGTIIRFYRRAENLTLAQLGKMCGYSASALSRMERGKQPLRDIAVLHSIATALSIPPELLGLAPAPHGAPAIASTPGAGAPMVDHRSGEGGDDPVRRRELLIGLGAVTGAAALGGSAAARTPGPQISLRGLEDILLNGAGAADSRPVPIGHRTDGAMPSQN